jgi:hypothetical protein
MVNDESMRRISEQLAHHSYVLRGVALGELRGLSEEELIERHDDIASEAGRALGRPSMDLVVHAQIYADELKRREAMRQGERMEELTKSINRLTWVVTVAPAAAAVAKAPAVVARAASLGQSPAPADNQR